MCVADRPVLNSINATAAARSHRTDVAPASGSRPHHPQGLATAAPAPARQRASNVATAVYVDETFAGDSLDSAAVDHRSWRTLGTTAEVKKENVGACRCPEHATSPLPWRLVMFQGMLP